MRWIYLFFTLLVIACGDTEIECTSVNYNESFVVTPDSKYCFPDGVEFQVISLENEFCPCFQTCVWEGQMKVESTITIDGNEVEYTLLSEVGFGNSPADPGIFSIQIPNDKVEFAETCEENPDRQISQATITFSK